MLKNKVALITGRSRGIEKSTVMKYDKNGCNIAFSYKNIEFNYDELINEVKCIAYRSDYSSFSESNNSIKCALNDFKKIDILVNNYGIVDDNLIVRMTENQRDSIINTNLKSVFNNTKAVIKLTMRKNGGKIINITSIIRIDGGWGQCNYAAAKAGVIGFTKSISKEIPGRNINVNAVAPGFIITDMTNSVSDRIRENYIRSISIGRLGVPEDVAKVCLFLASDMATYVNGQTIRVDGGL